MSNIVLPATGALPTRVSSQVTKIATPFMSLDADTLAAFGNRVPEKLEGLSIGPQLNDGSYLMLAGTDNDYSVTQNAGGEQFDVYFRFTDSDPFTTARSSARWGRRPAARARWTASRPTAATRSCPASCTPTRFRRPTSRPTCRRTRPTTRRWSRGALEAPLAASRAHCFASARATVVVLAHDGPVLNTEAYRLSQRGATVREVIGRR